MAAPTRFEDQVKWRFTRCLNDIIIKGIAATAFSILGTKMFLSKRVTTKGATLAGFGIAIGMSYQNCEREMQLALTTPCEKVVQKKKKGEDDCLELEKDDKKPQKMSSDNDGKEKQPDELKNDKKNKAEDLKNDKAKKAGDDKKKKAEDLKNEKTKKGAESKSDKNKKAEDGKAQKPVELKDAKDSKDVKDK